jgi:hypothetical protein
LTRPQRPFKWRAFQQDWRERWQRIEELLKEMEVWLDRRARGRLWDKSQPAILRFPPAEGLASMGRS